MKVYLVAFNYAADIAIFGNSLNYPPRSWVHLDQLHSLEPTDLEPTIWASGYCCHNYNGAFERSMQLYRTSLKESFSSEDRRTFAQIDMKEVS